MTEPEVQHAADEAQTEKSPDRVDELVDHLARREDVEYAEVDRSRDTPHIHVLLTATKVPRPVADLFREYVASIVPESLENEGDGLRFDVEVPELFHDIKSAEVKTWGNSLAFTYPRQGVDKSGLDEGDGVEIKAREGAILVVEE